jgi:hypothetical protein
MRALVSLAVVLIAASGATLIAYLMKRSDDHFAIMKNLNARIITLEQNGDRECATIKRLHPIEPSRSDEFEAWSQL